MLSINGIRPAPETMPEEEEDLEDECGRNPVVYRHLFIVERRLGDFIAMKLQG